MSAPNARVNQASPMVVLTEITAGSGQFAVDERVQVILARRVAGAEGASALVRVRLGNGLTLREAFDRYSADRRLAIRWESPDGDLAWLFDGFPVRRELRWGSTTHELYEALYLDCRSVLDRAAEATDAQVYGRQVRSAAQEDGTQPGLTHVTGLPCTFNADGEGNLSDQWYVDADHGSIGTFTYDADPSGYSWTYAQALRYLAYHHSMRLFLSTDPILDDTAAIATTRGGAVDEAGTSGLYRALLREPDDLNVDGLSAVEAVGLLCDRAGVYFHLARTTSGGEPRSELRVWARGSGTATWLYLDRPTDGSMGTSRSATAAADEIFELNNVAGGEISFDAGRVLTSPLGVGGVKLYEATFPLVAGWAPSADLDAAADSDAAKQAATDALDELAVNPGALATNTWLRRYHRSGADFADFGDVGRLWVLNEDGAFTDAPYSRGAAYDFGRALSTEEAATRRWMRRTRTFLPCVTRDRSGDRLSPVVQFSFDAGTTWEPVPGGAHVTVLADRCGLRVHADCLAELRSRRVTDAAGSEMLSVWDALVDDQLRVRATASVASDFRMWAEATERGDASQTLFPSSQVVDRLTVFQYRTRLNSNSVLTAADTEDPAQYERDDSAAFQEFVDKWADQSRDLGITGEPQLPWIETDYEIGTQIRGVRGRDFWFDTRRCGEDDWPHVAAITWDAVSQVTRLKLDHGDAPAGGRG